MIKEIFEKKSRWVFEVILLIILFSPLLYINVRNNSDWGGDFALYIHQAMNLVDGKPQTETGYIFNDQYPSLAPQTYPVGFPILLAPVYFLFGNKIIAFSYFISAILICLSVVMYFFFKIYFNKLISLFAVLLIVYNPWTLNFKSEILSDLPFTLFLISFLLGYAYLKYERNKIGNCIFLGLLAGFLILIKTIGIVLLVAIIIDVFLKIISLLKKKVPFQTIKPILFTSSVIIGSALFFYFLINYILIPSSKENITFFPSLFNFKNLKEILLNTSSYYILTFQEFFHPNNEKWEFLPLITRAFALTFFIVGYIKHILKKITILELFTAGYLFIILSFPNISQGFRYLLPVLPLAVYYIIEGLKSVNLEIKMKTNYIVFIVGMLCFLQYIHGISNIAKEQDTIVVGPQEQYSREAFDFISKNTPKNSVIIFIKPTVLSLYTNKKSMTNSNDQDVPTIEKKFKSVGANYYLTNTDKQNPPLDSFLLKHKDSIDMVWCNAKFKLYHPK